MNSSSAISFETLSLIGVVITSLLFAVAILTVVRSVLSKRQDNRDENARAGVRQALFHRLEEPEPEWEVWVEGLSDSERRVATDLLEEYLQGILERDRTALQQLGHALGIDKKAKRKLHHDNRFERLWALHWFARLDIDITIEALRTTTEVNPETRAAAARVLYEQERPDAARAGTELLLQGSKSLSVLGVDTLYQLNEFSPEPLLTSAKESYDSWTESRLIQVLQVIGEAGPAQPGTSLGWIGFLFLSDSPKVRAAAADSLCGYGWHNDVRSAVEIEQARTDESPLVRQAVYRMLGSWGDEASMSALLEAVRTESDPRAAADAIAALGERVMQVDINELSAASSAVRDWVLASEAAIEIEAAR